MNKLKIGLAKTDITPRVGVELQGYGPFLCRHSDGIREPLFARALAMEAGGEKAVIVSCDIIGISRETTQKVWEILKEKQGLESDRVLVHAIHTHSGPSFRMYSGWGTPDPPYLELLPDKIADACLKALDNLEVATVSYAEVPCEGIAINRRTDAFKAESAEAAIDDTWRPAKPEDTDLTCHVVRFDAGDRLLGFFSYYGCHPVIGGPSCKKIHSDWAGIATNLVEKENPGSVGLFLQGAQGDINSCIVGGSEEETMKVLDAVAPRYAGYVTDGLQKAKQLEVDSLKTVQKEVIFSRKKGTRKELEQILAEQEAVLHAPGASDEDRGVRMAMVYALSMRSLIAKLERGEELSGPVSLHGIKLGPLEFLGGPFEIFRAIKNDVIKKAKAKIPLVMGFTDDSIGYAFDHQAAEKGGYEPEMVPFICQQLPFANIHDELVEGLLSLDRELNT